MPTYTLVVVAPNELEQDDVIQLAERIGVVAFCGPGSLVQLDEDDVPSVGAAITERAAGPLEASAGRSRDAGGVASPEAVGDGLCVPIEFDGRRVEVHVLRRTDETGPLLRLVGINCELDGDGPGDYYLSAPD